MWTAVASFASAQAVLGTLIVSVESEGKPVQQAEIRVGDVIALTDERGQAVLQLPPGDLQIAVQRFGFRPETARGSVRAGDRTTVTIELHSESVLEEEIIVTATRTERRIQDQPLRVEVLNREEIEERALMTPGDVAMLLNETAGLRVQVTSPSLGAANVRVQGLKGRYTQVLTDGLPLYGGQTGAIGLLQIPPMDLGQVEVIKGVASALYGASALGGVINLVSRRPREAEREILVNRTTRGGTDAVLWVSAPARDGWSYTLLGGGHFQDRADIDRDGWADLPAYQRGLARPRIFWDNGTGRSIFATIGVMGESREGGTMPGATVADGRPFAEELGTRRLDAGFVGRLLVGARVVSFRASAMGQRHVHQFGDVTEHDRHQTGFAEGSITGTNAAHTWVLGAALQRDGYRSHDVPRFNYTYTVPGAFAQDDYSPVEWVTLSASGRLDIHNEFGTHFNPRISGLLRLPRRWTVRTSVGTGFFAPTPFTEETEAVGLTRLLPLRGLRVERARGGSVDVGWALAAVELNATAFGSIISDPAMLRQATESTIEIVNASGPTRTVGSDLLARFRRGEFAVTGTYTYVRSTEIDPLMRRDRVPLTPAHSISFTGVFEDEEGGRIGIEGLFTGRQRLDDNPYRPESEPYWIVGFLVERRVGRLRVFVNGENLTNVRQTRFDPLLRRQRLFDGRWTVEEWAPLEGRIINGGIRLGF
jgi:iron complex outermembrane receptor protein